MSSLFYSTKVSQHIQSKNLEFDPLNASFVLGFMVVALVGLPIYLFQNDWTWGPWILGFVLYWVTGLGITMGYHRYFSHRTYDASPVVEFFLLIAGSMALQNSALKWSSDHRKHHSFTDTDKDPYNAKLGFIWSHLLWIFYSNPVEKHTRLSSQTRKESLIEEFPNCRDLINKPMIRIQNVLSIPMGLILSFALPALIGYFMGNVWGYVLIAGFVRIAAVHNSTFFINSLAHIWGDKPHSEKDTSCDSPFLAFLSFGEGYHNYHHTYPNDYRNGIKAYHFDPTKWLIKSLSWVGLTRNLKMAKRRVEDSVEPHNVGVSLNLMNKKI